MEQKQDIGKLIQKQFEVVEKSPPDTLWTKIDGTLQKGQKKKRILLLVFLFALILGLNSIWFLGDFHKQTNDAIQTKTTEVSNENGTLESGTENNNATKIVSGSTEVSLIKEEQLTNSEPSEPLKSNYNLPLKNKNSQASKESSGSEKTRFDFNQNQSDLNEQQEHIQNTIKSPDATNTNIEDNIAEVSPEHITDSIPDDINKSISLEEKKEEKEEEETQTNKRSKKWAVTILGGLETYSSFNKGSLVNPGLDGFKRSGTLDYTYGIALRFDLTEKLAISYGVNKTSFSYYTLYIPSSNETEINRILNYTDLESGQTISSTELSNLIQNETQTDLLHQIEYYELPFIIRYNLSNKRLGVQTLAGLSTYLVNKENLYVQNENDDQLKIGSLNNLTGARFSLNLGFGLYYELSDSFLIELNPTFKYSLSKYSSRTSGDKPYNFGIFTGLTYRIF